MPYTKNFTVKLNVFFTTGQIKIRHKETIDHVNLLIKISCLSFYKIFYISIVLSVGNERKIKERETLQRRNLLTVNS